MYNTIMAPTDGSGFDREAIRVATQMSNRAGAIMKLVRVASAPMVFTGPDSIDYPHEAIKREREWEVSQLDELAAECRAETRGIVTADLEEGPVPDALGRFARLNNVDLIVISSHGRGGFARLSLGSVTDSLIRSTNIPVLVVKAPSSYLNPTISRPFQQILVPLDGSLLAEEIIPQVIELAQRNEASVTLFHALIPSTYSQRQIGDAQLPWWEEDVEIARSYLSEQAEWIRSAGVPTSIELTVDDNVADSISRSACRLRADLIAIATRGRGGFSRMIRGSVADKIVRTSRTSLLVFHPKTPAAAQKTAGKRSAVWQPMIDSAMR
jgi:nucleotide-binding universal stress UspA family protein